MDIRYFNNVTFVKSVTKLSERPSEKLPEIAFAGRSNVGKSSLLNAICNRRSLAKTSSLPGKTQLINYFKINEFGYFVDLPGYGFSKVPRSVSDSWGAMIEEFIVNSNQLRLICLLIDSRHTLQENDKQMIDWLFYQKKPFNIILTKSDKISRARLNIQISRFRNILPDNRVIPVSIKSEKSIFELNKYLYSLFIN